jgi:hypothetical protein
MAHPYTDLPNRQFWSRSVAGTPAFEIDPVDGVRAFTIARATKVATAGSCFAQHIARALKTSGFTYYVPEPGPPALGESERAARGYGLFSARYGNIYTVRQLLQLFQRAFGLKQYPVDAWPYKGRWVDPFRPTCEPDGFASPEELAQDQLAHLACVRVMFQQLDVFVFTLGLTEGWVHRSSGAVLPVAPGVSGGEWNPADYEFVNFGVSDVSQDLHEFIALLRSVNPRAKVILTVSPVPLAATYEQRHVMVSTTMSKAVLRVAAGEAESRLEDVVYFPSFEIITLPALGGRYFEDDLRSVRPGGVRHVMRMFFRHFTDSSAPLSAEITREAEAAVAAASAVVCDEELIERAR